MRERISVLHDIGDLLVFLVISVLFVFGGFLFFWVMKKLREASQLDLAYVGKMERQGPGNGLLREEFTQPVGEM